MAFVKAPLSAPRIVLIMLPERKIMKVGMLLLVSLELED